MRENMLYCSESKYRKVFIFDIILILGLLSYAIIFFTINKTLNPLDIAGEHISAEIRLFWRGLAEKICAVCSVIYVLGHSLVIYNAIKQKVHFSLKKLVFYFFVQIGIMLACVIPFGLLDHVYFFDYIFPLYSLVILVSVLFVVSLFTIRRRK